MGSISQDALNKILAGQTMTARQRASLDGHGAWVGVVSLETVEPEVLEQASSAVEDGLGWVHVRTFEEDATAHEPAVGVQRFEVNGVRELEALLEHLGVDPATLAPKKGMGRPF